MSSGESPLLLPVAVQRRSPWTAPTSLRRLFPVGETASVWRFQPECCYHVIDEKRFRAEGESLFALICELEACPDRDTFNRLLQRLKVLASKPEFIEARRSLSAWLQEALLPQKNIVLHPPAHALDEVITMAVDFPAQAKLETLRQNIATLYERRHGQVPEDLQSRLRATQDVASLQTWFDGMAEDVPEQARHEGELDSLRRSLNKVYERRFGEMPYALRAKLDATHDMNLLESWFDLAITESVEVVTLAITS